MNLGLGFRRLAIAVWLAGVLVLGLLIAIDAKLYAPMEILCSEGLNLTSNELQTTCHSRFESESFREGLTLLAWTEGAWTAVVVAVFRSIGWIATGFRQS